MNVCLVLNVSNLVTYLSFNSDVSRDQKMTSRNRLEQFTHTHTETYPLKKSLLI